MSHRVAVLLGTFVGALALAACGDVAAPPAAAEPGTRPALAAVQEKGEGVFVGSGTTFLPCIGESVQSQSSNPFRYHRTVTPSGNTVFTDQFIHDAATGTAVGLTSGTVWTLGRVASPEVIRVNAGEMAAFTANIWWVSETGPTINIHSTFHFSQNANGEVTVDRFEVRCKTH